MKFARYSYARRIATATFATDEYEIHLEYQRCSQDRRNAAVTAELKVSMSDNGSEAEPLHRSSINLTSSRAQQDLARHLKSRRQEVDWLDLLDAANWRVIDSVREGQQPILLRDADPQPNGGAILPPLLNSPDPCILFGDGGAAKSYLGLAIALSLHGERPLCGLKPTRRLQVAYLDFEWDPWPHRRRMEKLWGPGKCPDLLYVPCALAGPLSAQVDRLRRILHDHGTEYVAIDSVGLAAAGPPEDSAVALDFFQALAQLEVGSLLTAHVNRAADTWKPFGSAFWHNSARATWYIERASAERGEVTVTLHNRKTNEGALKPPIGLRFTFSDGDTFKDAQTTIERVEVPEAEGTSLVSQIEAALAEQEPQTYTELGLAIGVQRQSIQNTVARNPLRFRVDTSGRSHRVSRRAADTADKGADTPFADSGADNCRQAPPFGQQTDGAEFKTPTADKSADNCRQPTADTRGGLDPPVSAVEGIDEEFERAFAAITDADRPAWLDDLEEW